MDKMTLIVIFIIFTAGAFVSSSAENNVVTNAKKTLRNNSPCIEANVVCPALDGPDSVYSALPDCTKFCQCSNGIPYLHNCPSGLHFNPILNVCDWPNNAGCTEGITQSSAASTTTTTTQSSTTPATGSTAAETTTTTTTTTQSTTSEANEITTTEATKSTTTTKQSPTTEATESTSLNECAQANITCPKVDGADSVYAPLPDCTKFCQCSNGVPYLHECHGGLHFNPVLNVCDWPSNAGCTGGSTQSTAAETTTTAKSTTTEATETTTANECVQANITCPEVDGADSVYAPLPDCTKFCQCSNGVPYLHECHGGLHFNPVLNVCDWPNNAGCTGGSTQSTAAETTTTTTTAKSTTSEVNEITTTETTESTTANECVQANITCPKVDGADSVYAPLPDCTKFCQCSNGVPYLHECHGGLHFNPVLNVCDWPSNAGCTGGSTQSTAAETTTTTAKSTTSEANEITTTEATETTTANECVQANITCAEVDGADSVYAPLPDCTKFCQCSNGVPYLHECHGGLHFNPVLNVCDWPSNAGCTGGSTTQSAAADTTTTTTQSTTSEASEITTTEATESTNANECVQANITCPKVDGADSVYAPLPDCTKFCQCSNGIPYLHECHGGLHFNPVLNVCDWPSNAGCTSGSTTQSTAADTTTTTTQSTTSEASEITTTEATESTNANECVQANITCPKVDGADSVYAPLPDCTKFCQCSNGVPYLHECHGGLHFNPVLNVCDWPNNAGCTGGSTQSTASETTTTTTQSTTSEANEITTNEATESTTANECVQANITCPKVDGADSVYAPLPDCTKFCQCSNGVPYLHECHGGLHFNPVLNVCDWPNNAGCTGGITQSTASSNTTTEKSAATEKTEASATESPTTSESSTTVESEEITTNNEDTTTKEGSTDSTQSTDSSNTTTEKSAATEKTEASATESPTTSESSTTVENGEITTNNEETTTEEGSTDLSNTTTEKSAATEKTEASATESPTTSESSTTVENGKITTNNEETTTEEGSGSNTSENSQDITSEDDSSTNTEQSTTDEQNQNTNEEENISTDSSTASVEPIPCSTVTITETTITTTVVSGSQYCLQNIIACPAVDGQDSLYSALPDCTKFCQCSNGIPYLQSCPDGLHFNPEINVCDWPKNAGCINQNSTTSPNTVIETTTECSAYSTTIEQITDISTGQEQESTSEGNSSDGSTSEESLKTTEDGLQTTEDDVQTTGDGLQTTDFEVNTTENASSITKNDEGETTTEDNNGDDSENTTIDSSTISEATTIKVTTTEDVTINDVTTGTETNGTELCLQTGLVCPTVDGPDSVYGPGPECTNFCQCSNGIPYLHICNDGLHFNPILNVCDWLEAAGCASSSTTVVPDTSSIIENDENETTTENNNPDNGSSSVDDSENTTIDSSTISEATTIKVTTTEDVTISDATTGTETNGTELCLQTGLICPTVDGPDSVYGPGPECTNFCQCSNGVPYLHICNDGLHFNPILNVCDWPEAAGCASSSTTVIPDTSSTVNQNDSETTEGDIDDQENGRKICQENNVVCPEVDPTYPVFTALPDCTKYCKCSNGAPYLFNCPANLHFNPDLNVCDWPQNAGCKTPVYI